MQYTIMTEQLAPKLFKVQVSVTNDEEVIIVEGETRVCTTDEQIARDYGVFPFLHDLRSNDERLASLALPTDTPPVEEPIPEEPPTEGV